MTDFNIVTTTVAASSAYADERPVHTNPAHKSKMTRKNSTHVLRSIFGIAIVAIVAGCSKADVSAPIIRPALTYKITAANGANSASLDIYSGEIRARYEADHAFRIGGKMVKRLVDAGTTVKRGQALALLDPQDINLAAAAAVSQVSAQQTEADFAEAELKRFRDLFSKGFVSQSALDQKINVANAARARLDAQKATANVARNQAGYATLTAEMDGVVTMVAAEAGQVVAAGQVVMKIANPREKELVIAVPEAKIAAFRAGADYHVGSNASASQKTNRAARVHLWSQPEKLYAARVREIAGSADPATRTYAARISIEGEGSEVGLGMSAYVAFDDANVAGAFVVPMAALYFKADQANVWVVSADGKVKLTAVTVLQYRETTALISSNATAQTSPTPDVNANATASLLKLSDIIVAAGVHKLREGEIVRPIVDKEIKGEAKVESVAAASKAAEVAKSGDTAAVTKPIAPAR